MKNFFLLVGLCPALLFAESKVGAAKEPVSTAVATPRPIPETPIAAIPVQTVTMSLKWNDTGGGFRIPVQNPTDRPMRIDAIQSSGDLFIASFPSNVPPRGSSDIIAVLDAKPGTNNESDVIRLKTDQGEKTLVVAHQRESVTTLSAKEVTWTVGEASAPKSVALQVAGGVTKLAKARAYAGATAVVNDLGDGKFRIDITPKSTAEPASFPVILEFSPALPGVTPVITGSVKTKG